jgi:hypothetical protein
MPATLVLIVFGVMLTSKSPFVIFSPTRGRSSRFLLTLLLAGGLFTLLLQADWSHPAGQLAAFSPGQGRWDIAPDRLSGTVRGRQCPAPRRHDRRRLPGATGEIAAMLTIGLHHYLLLAAVVFSLGILCMVTKRNAIGILIGVDWCSMPRISTCGVQPLPNRDG